MSVSSDQSLSRDQIGLFLLCGTPLVAFRRIVVGKRLVQSLGSLQASKAHHCKSVRPVTGGFLASKKHITAKTKLLSHTVSNQVVPVQTPCTGRVLHVVALTVAGAVCVLS